MAPNRWVLLKREIFIEHDVSDTGGDSLIGERSTKREAILAYPRALKPEAGFADPPELSSLRILRPARSTAGIDGDFRSAYIASGDKNLVALFADPYRPTTNSGGGYLMYDAANNSLSTIPPPPYEHDRSDAGMGAAVVACLEDGGYVLAELTMVRSSWLSSTTTEPTMVALYTWHSSTEEWVLKVASFPDELSYPGHYFQADMSFAFRGSSLCWVDLFKGMAVCDLRAGADPGEFRFVPLPGECWTYDRRQTSTHKYPLQPEEFRSMACVGGSIKFITMDGYGDLPGNEVTLTIWTLSLDLCTWKKGEEYNLKDIWASESHSSLGLPQVLPSFPVLSMDEDDVVYLFFTDLEVKEDGEREYKSHCLIRADVQHKKVSHHQKSADEMPFQLFNSEILASECSAYLQGLEDHQEKRKARKVGESGKRVVL